MDSYRSPVRTSIGIIALQFNSAKILLSSQTPITTIRRRYGIDGKATDSSRQYLCLVASIRGRSIKSLVVKGALNGARFLYFDAPELRNSYLF